ncbi:DUF2521 family protein [Bacillus testis]|uniref:DUF2521 family protein n=1 Tax=Bacillus testis TaxID=1622072 RepID=UPI00067EFCD8|nr:DUF2521 family protein [Bacillus testis]
MGTVIHSFTEKRKERQLGYERKVLKEITPKMLKERFQAFVNAQKGLGLVLSQVLEEGCYDVAIEAFLLGANYSKFGFFGESYEEVKERCQEEEKHLTDTLFNFILYWGKVSDYDLYNESLYYECEQYVNSWWAEGFQKGAKRYRLRLH